MPQISLWPRARLRNALDPRGHLARVEYVGGHDGAVRAGAAQRVVVAGGHVGPAAGRLRAVVGLIPRQVLVHPRIARAKRRNSRWNWSGVGSRRTREGNARVPEAQQDVGAGRVRGAHVRVGLRARPVVAQRVPGGDVAHPVGLERAPPGVGEDRTGAALADATSGSAARADAGTAERKRDRDERDGARCPTSCRFPRASAREPYSSARQGRGGGPPPPVRRGWAGSWGEGGSSRWRGARTRRRRAGPGWRWRRRPRLR
jgi:hypothetical protein